MEVHKRRMILTQKARLHSIILKQAPRLVYLVGSAWSFRIRIFFARTAPTPGLRLFFQRECPFVKGFAMRTTLRVDTA